MNKRKLQPISYGLTKSEASFQVYLAECMSKLVEGVRENNLLLREILKNDHNLQKESRISQPHKTPHSQSNNSEYPRQHIGTHQELEEGSMIQHKSANYLENLLGGVTTNRIEQTQKQVITQPKEESKEPFQINSLFQLFQKSIQEVSQSNKKLVGQLNIILANKGLSAQKEKNQSEANDMHSLQQFLLNTINKKDSKKGYQSYGIISQIMPFSDKRQIKIRYRIDQLLDQETDKKLNIKEWKIKLTQWIGMVFRATASICWNMLLNDSLSFEEVKILFTENIIFNYIELMRDLSKYLNEEASLPILQHINSVSCEVLEYLCKQYPQTRIQAPNLSLKNAIPSVQNQGLAKCDLISMVCKENIDKTNPLEEISFEFREDKDYSSAIMKTINYIIDNTQKQYDHFQKIMSTIFEKIYLPKDKRNQLKVLERFTAKLDNLQHQYREKVKGYSHYAIGRKIPKNTPKYSDLEIQYGVFFVKAPSILRIIAKWLQQLDDFVSKTDENLKNTTLQLKDHRGKVVGMSKRVRNLLFQSISDFLPKIRQKNDKIKQECYWMEYVLTGEKYILDQKQIHLSDDQLCVGKFCSHLKNAISSYLCSQLSKIIYYLQLIPTKVDFKVLQIADQDFQEQAKRHISSVNLVSLKIFDLLRCKCHSNQQEIVWVVQALKMLQKEDPKFQIIRVKDRLNLGTRDVLINAQYNGGLVWQIQLAVTSNVQKKQGLLDKYNHFLYQLKRAKLGPVSQCVTIWTALQQKSLYFEQLNNKKKSKNQLQPITHKSKDCNGKSILRFTQFKRPIICFSCKQYYAIPTTSLLNIRCEDCKITYCGTCFYYALSVQDKKRFMFQNYQQKKLLTKGAFDQLQEYTDFKKPLPKEGFFIKKKFLNRQLSFFTVVVLQKNKLVKDEVVINLSQTVLRKSVLDFRSIHKNEIIVKEVNGQYFLQKQSKQLNDFWIFYFPNKKLELINLNQLQKELKQANNFGNKYLNVLSEPNYMNQLHTIKKSFEKARLLNDLKEAQDADKYLIGVYRFNNFNILAKYQVKAEQLKEILVKKINKSLIKKFTSSKASIISLQQKGISNQFDLVVAQKNAQFMAYLEKVQKLFLADNLISNITFMQHITNLQYLSISKNYLVSFKGITELFNLQYIKFDENQIESLQQLSNLVLLKYISGNFNKIKSLRGIQKLKDLGSISLCANKIQSVSQLANLKIIQRIYLRQNPIKDCSPLSSLHLKHLYMGQTLIDVSQIAKYSFLERLSQISLKGNALTHIPKIFDKTVNLLQLKLNQNQISKIENLDSLQKLTLLDLNENLIEKMENLGCLISIEEIKLKKNKIKVIEGVKGYIQTLKKLNLEQNPLDDLSQYLLYEEKPKEQMRLTFTEDKLSEKAAQQLINHSAEINNKSQGDD